MNTPPATMLSLLPHPEPPVPGESFNDRILLLLAAVAQADNLLTYRAYQQVQEACRAIFGEQGLHAETQAKLHHALLHPPVNPQVIARHMARQAEEQKVASAFVDTMLTALSSIASHEERLDVQGRQLVCEIGWAFRRSAFDEPASGTDNLTSRITALCKRAASSLPGFGSLGDKTSPGFRRVMDNLFVPETTRFNQHMGTAIAELERVAWTIGDADLSDRLRQLQLLLREQTFKVVVVGERKRGKSSLINALLGQALSPVRESTPETATVVAFRYSGMPDYTVQYLDEKQFQNLDGFLHQEQGNLLLVDKIARIRKGVDEGSFTPGKLLAGITCWEDLREYISRDGRYASFVGRVSVGLPIAGLKEGLELVDTPGLNDTDAFHDYLSYEESLGADCVVFVMDARDPGSQSELALLRRIARAGRAVTLVGVLTNIDKLNSVSSLERAREQARAVLLEACRAAPLVKVGGIVALNARAAMEEACTAETGRSASSGEFATLLTLLHDALTTDVTKEAYRAKIRGQFTELVRLTRERLGVYGSHYRASLPAPELLGMLEKHAEQLAAATRSSMTQARQVVDAAARDMDAWNEETERALDRFTENLILRIMDAVYLKVNALGRQFARDSEWEAFEKNDVRTLARRSLEDFLSDQHRILEVWENKLQLFSSQMQQFSQACLTTAGSSLTGLEEPDFRTETSGNATHFLVQTHYYMKHLAVFTTGAALGRASVLSPLTLLISAGNILALSLTSPLIMAVVAAVAGTAGFIYHLGREDKRRAAFLERKRKEAEAYAAAIRKALHDALSTTRADLGKAYAFEVRCGFTPALESLFYQSMHMRLFLDVMHKIRADGVEYEKHVEKQLTALGCTNS